MTECMKSEAIMDNCANCVFAAPSTEMWRLECKNDCVRSLAKQVLELKGELSTARQNNRKLVAAFEKFLPMCRDVVKASEAVKREPQSEKEDQSEARS